MENLSAVYGVKERGAAHHIVAAPLLHIAVYADAVGQVGLVGMPYVGSAYLLKEVCELLEASSHNDVLLVWLTIVVQTLSARNDKKAALSEAAVEGEDVRVKYPGD